MKYSNAKLAGREDTCWRPRLRCSLRWRSAVDGEL